MTSLFGNEGPQLVEVDRWLEVLIFLIVEVTLSLLAEVVWMAIHGETNAPSGPTYYFSM